MNEQTSRDPIEMLAEQFVQKYRQGERPTIEEFALENTEFADDIRNLFPMIVDIEQLKGPECSSPAPGAASGIGARERLGDFRIIREIGRGGMGVVYEAEQQSLGRRVALKVIGGNVAASAHGVRRFRREAEAAARLHHTNIVPIYGVGEEDGISFYAMQMIDGVGLDVVLDALRNGTTPPSTSNAAEAVSEFKTGSTTAEAALEVAAVLRDGSTSQTRKRFRPDSETLSSPDLDAEQPPVGEETRTRSSGTGPKFGPRYWKSVARLGAAAAGALHYAHRHGVLHRDVKPSNLLLDREANLWIADFGLAKHAESDNLTKTGDVVGTLRYMAPEQFEGTTDHRSDIYSLGLTLYELLTLQHAFEDSHQGPLIRQKMHGAPPSPRTRNPAIPRDLETIILKASAAAPGDRYQSAGELAEDLERFLDERPVAARRAGPAEQFWRWCRRNPAIALSSALTLALLITTAVVSLASNVAIRSALTAAEEARNDSLRSQQLAEENLSLAIDAFESIFDNVANRGVPQSLEFEYEDDSAPKFETVLSDADADLLRELLTFYERFARQNSPDEQLQARTADAYHRIGLIHQRLGHVEEAKRSYTDALAIYDKLLADHPADVDRAVAKSRLLNDLGVLLEDQMRRSDKIADYHVQAIEFLEKLPATIANKPAVRYELARSHDLAGSAFFRNFMGSPSLAQTGGGSADSMSGPMLDSPGRPPEGRPPEGPRRDGPPPDGQRFGPPREFGPENADSHPDRRRRGPRGPRPESWQDEDHGPRPDFGPGGLRVDPKEFTEHHLALAYEIVSGLLEEAPADPEYRLLLAQIERHRLIHLRLGDRAAEASEPFETARSVLSQLVDDYPREPQYRMELADTLALASSWLPSISEKQAEDYLAEAIELCRQLTTAFPNASQYQALLATAYRNLARVQQSSGDLNGAEQSLDLARARLEALVARGPAKEFHEAALIFVLRDLADLKRSRGEKEDDKALLSQARDLLDNAIGRYAEVSSEQKDPFRRGIQSSLYDSLSKTLALLGDQAGAESAAAQARTFSDSPFRSPFGPFRPRFGRHGRGEGPPDRRRDEPSESVEADPPKSSDASSSLPTPPPPRE